MVIFFLLIGVKLACFQIFGTLPEFRKNYKKDQREEERLAEQVL